MKKILSVILSGLMMVTMFSSCGQTQEQPQEQKSETSTDSSTSTDTNEKVEITFFCHDAVKSPEGDYLRQKQVDAFNESSDTVHVTLELFTEGSSLDYLKKLDLLSLSGTDYDVASLPSYANYAERAESGVFAPIGDLVKEKYGSYDDAFAYPAEIDGEFYGLPYNPSIYYVIINKDMLDAAGLEAPPLDWTWDDYREYANKMTSGTGAEKVYGSYMHTWTEYRREALFSTKMDNPFINDDGTSNMKDPVFKEWLQYVYDMENVDGSQLSYAEAKAGNMAYRDVFFNGKAGMILTGSWIMDNIKDTEQFPHEFQTIFAPMPIWKDGKEGRATGSCTYNAINAKSEKQEAAFEFLQYMSGEANEVVNQVSAQKNADNGTVLKASVTGHEDLYDIDSLIAVWNNPKLEPNIITQYPNLMSEIDELYNVETEKFFLGNEDLDKVLETFATKGEELLEANK